MTYENYESSPDEGLQASLFLIQYGSEDANYFAYTDIDVPVTFDGVEYAPTVIGREKIESSGGLDNKTLEIDITPSASVVKFYQNRQPSQVVTITIRQGHVDDPANDFVVVWTGRIIGIEQKSRYAKISAEPVATSMKRPGLRRHYQYGCPWALYSDDCGADRAAGSVVAAVFTVGLNVIEFTPGWEGAKPAGKFAGGYIQWADADDNSLQTRTILSVQLGAGTDGRDRLALNGSTDGLEELTVMTLFVGCNHGMSDCAGLHDNIQNFGGQPWIPQENPVGFVNRFY